MRTTTQNIDKVEVSDYDSFMIGFLSPFKLKSVSRIEVDYTEPTDKKTAEENLHSYWLKVGSYISNSINIFEYEQK